MNNIKKLSIVAVVAFLSACTAIDVKPISGQHRITHICIRENPKVIVRDFLPAIEDILQSYLITSDVYTGRMPEECEYKMTYVAYQKWDIATYMRDAEVKVYTQGRQIGYAHYHLRGGGGFSLMKWMGSKSKMTPVMDELFSEIK